MRPKVKVIKVPEPIRISKGKYQKVIEADPFDNSIYKRIYNGYFIFEIKVGKKANFHLRIIDASNIKATGENVYWVAQSIKNFKTTKWLRWKNANNKYKFHELLKDLDKGTIFEGTNYTKAYTKNIGYNYIATNPYKDRDNKRNGVLFGNLGYITNKLGAGIWIEGINYTPEYKSQGAFIVAVGEPQILSFFVEKRIDKERIVDQIGLIEDDTVNVEKQLIYGDILDLHLHVHNVLGYSVHIELKANGKTFKNYRKIIHLSEYLDKKNPGLHYNLKIIDELLVDLRWAKSEDNEHIVGKGNNDSLLEYTMILHLTPPTTTIPYKPLPKLKKEVTFTVNYKEDFSFDVQEIKYVAQVVKIHQPPLVTQSFETCNYSEIKITPKGEDTFILLKEEENGALTEPKLSDDNKTPYYELVTDSDSNKLEVTIDVVAHVEDCVNEELHTNNVFMIHQLKTNEVTSDFFGTIEPIEIIGTPTESKLKLQLAYPYQSGSDFELFKKYIFGGEPYSFWIGIQSCRYKRTPSFKVYPGIEWILKISVASLKPEVYSYTRMGASSRTPVHNARARTAAINRKSKSQEVIFELKLDAKYNGSTNEIINASYENKIKRILEAIVFIKDTLDSLSGITGAKKGMAAKVGKKLFKLPFTFQLDFPVVSIEGSWNYGYMGKGVVKRQGSLTFGFTPLIKGTGKIDLIVASEYIPVVGQIIKAADLVLLVAGIEIYFNLYAFGEVNLTGTIHFNKKDNFNLDSKTVLGIGAELGLLAEASTKKLTFAAETTRDEKVVGFELAIKGETSLTVIGKAGHAEKGPFIEIDVGYDGITVFVTAKYRFWGGSIGPDKKPFLLVKPKKEIFKKRWYFVDNQE